MWGPLSVVASLICALVIAEIGLRVLYRFTLRHELEFTTYSLLFKRPIPSPDLPFEHRPDYSAELMGVTLRTNAGGMRGGPVSTVKAPGTFRIACVGDSLTLAWGVREEDSYCEQVARRLTAKPLHSGMVRAEGLNFGVGNYNLLMELSTLRRKVFTYTPDVVVLMYFINDAEPIPQESRWAFLGHSYVAVFLWSRVDLLLRQAGLRSDYVQYYRGLYDEDRPAFLAFREAIKQFARECRDHRTPLAVIVAPELHRLDPGEPFQDLYAKVQGWWEAEGVPVINLWPVMRGQEPSQFWVHPADVHPNARAQTIAATSLEQFLRQQVRAH